MSPADFNPTTPKTKANLKHKLFVFVVIIFLLSIFSWYIAWSIHQRYHNHFLPNIYIDEILVEDLEENSAINKINQHKKTIDPNFLFLLEYENSQASATASQLKIQHDVKKAVRETLISQQTDSIKKSLANFYKSLSEQNKVSLELDYDKNEMDNFIKSLELEVQKEPKRAIASLNKLQTPNQPRISVFAGELGLVADYQKTAQELIDLFSRYLESEAFKSSNNDVGLENNSAKLDNNNTNPNDDDVKSDNNSVKLDDGDTKLNNDDEKPDSNNAGLENNNPKNKIRSKLYTKKTGTILSEQEISNSIQRAEKFLSSKIVIKNDQKIVETIPDSRILEFLNLPNDYFRPNIDIFIASTSAKVNRPAQDAKLVFDKSQSKIKEFQPDMPGLEVMEDDLLTQIITALNSLENSQDEATKKEEVVALSLKTTPAKIPLKNTNDLGINELIGSGESRYQGSIPARVHNVSLASSKINLTILKPQKEFSFNKALGDISQASGYKPAYIIKSGITQLGDGGGVCQVSSTLFRSVLDSGLEITRRIPHSYRVGYYELNSDPGFDATVYSGNIDLRFKNNTPAHVLIRTIVDEPNRHMIIELYGTNDGRSTEIANYKKWGATPQKPNEYFPDPSLAPGSKKQIDWGVSGLSASFDHIIYDQNNEVVSKKTYTSNYRPWSNKFLVGM